MSKKLISMALITILTLVIVLPGQSFAGKNIPKTAINSILNYTNGLELTDSQIKKLSIINKTIIEKMIQVQGQANIRKMEIDNYTANWNQIHGTAVKHTIKEYYEYLTELKQLELEAIMKARAILTENQLRKYKELATIEAMMIKLDTRLSGI